MKILIVEDEARIARRLERMTRNFFGDKLTLLLRIGELEEAIEVVGRQEIDLLMLDLNLNGQDGFEVLKTASVQSFHIIIISAYKEQAIHAFEYEVLDFVPKPFDQNRLEKALLRVTQAESMNQSIKFLAVKKRDKVRLIELGEIRYIQGADIYTQIHLNDGTKELHNKSLDRLRQILPDSFERIHKSYLVPMREASELVIQAGGKYQLRIKGGELLPIGRTRYRDLKRRWFD